MKKNALAIVVIAFALLEVPVFQISAQDSSPPIVGGKIIYLKQSKPSSYLNVVNGRLQLNEKAPFRLQENTSVVRSNLSGKARIRMETQVKSQIADIHDQFTKESALALVEKLPWLKPDDAIRVVRGTASLDSFVAAHYAENKAMEEAAPELAKN